MTYSKGKFVHLVDDTGWIDYQGRIAWTNPQRIIIRLFSWIDGRDNGSKTMTTAEFLAMNPTCYDSAGEMRAAYDKSGRWRRRA